MGPMAHLLMEENNGNNSGGSGNNNQGGNNNQNNNQGAKTVTMSQEQFDSIMSRLPPAPKKAAAAGNNQQTDDETNDEGDDLAAKAKKEADAKAKRQGDSKAMESALNFTIQAAEWLKTNAALLPKNIAEIFAQAEKEKYDDVVQKASAIKSAIIQSFFDVQENLDFLTAAQKVTLEDWRKLTKNAKEEQAQSVYDVVFEPTFESVKRVRKAQQVQQSGARSGGDAEERYKQKLINGSTKHYTGVTKNA